MRSSSSNESTTIRPTPALQRALELGVRLVVAVEHDAFRRESGRAARHAARRPVATSRSETLFGDEPRHRGAQERLARVRTRRLRNAAKYSRHRAAQLRLVVDVQRCAERLGELGKGDAGERDAAARRPTRERGRAARRRTARSRFGFVVVDRRRCAPSRPARARRGARARWRADPARLGQPQPGLGELGVVGEHAAVAVEAVEGASRNRAPT